MKNVLSIPPARGRFETISQRRGACSPNNDSEFDSDEALPLPQDLFAKGRPKEYLVSPNTNGSNHQAVHNLSDVKQAREVALSEPGSFLQSNEYESDISSYFTFSADEVMENVDIMV